MFKECQKLFFLGGSSLPGDHRIELETSTKASKVIISCTSELVSLNNSNSTSKEPSSSSSQRYSLDAKARLMEMKPQLPDKLILGHLNINSIRNKFDGLKIFNDNKIDIFLISETKLDDSFRTAQFLSRVLALLTHMEETLKVEDYFSISEKMYHPNACHVRLTMKLTV